MSRPSFNLAEFRPNVDLGQFVTLPKVETVVSTDASTNKSILLLAASLLVVGVVIVAIAKN